MWYRGVLSNESSGRHGAGSGEAASRPLVEGTVRQASAFEWSRKSVCRVSVLSRRSDLRNGALETALDGAMELLGVVMQELGGEGFMQLGSEASGCRCSAATLGRLGIPTGSARKGSLSQEAGEHPILWSSALVMRYANKPGC